MRLDAAAKMAHRGHSMYEDDFTFCNDFNAFNVVTGGGKTSFYEDGDYFLSLSKDRRSFKPIPVSEL